ncbi:MAG: undecaprenyl-diphosphate phosphatase, partial [Actinobacteria bacterium]|nr:undecaprenyl-diphosphate phosphatase [Actinomycetota bacterium]
MSLLHAIILGAVQGLGEFLPISSSGHLVLVPWLFKFHDALSQSDRLAFDVALHFGTAMAVLLFFRTDFVRLIKAFFSSVKKKSASTADEKFAWYLLIGSIPGGIVGVLLEKKVESVFNTLPLLIAGSLAAMGIILLAADRMSKGTKDITRIGFKDAVIVGSMQALAIIPGVSRSGITITTSLFRNFNRRDAARFSFLLSAPITFGAAVYEARKLIHVHAGFSFFVGVAVSAVVGYFSIKYLLKFLEVRS